MARKNRPNQKKQQPQTAPGPQPVVHGQAFAAFMREAQSIGNEVEARRAFDNEVGVYLKEKGLVDDFEGWRKARATPPAAT